MKEQSISIKIKQIIVKQTGSVSIEFVFMITLLVFMFAFMADLAIMRSTMGKLDNASYSLSNILRERKQLFLGDERLDQLNRKDFDNFKRLANEVIFPNNESSKVYVVLESLTFTTTSSKPIANYTVIGDTQYCQPYRELSKQEHLSPYSEGSTTNKPRKVPLYQVTLCLEVPSFFKSMVLNNSQYDGNKLRSSSITVAR